jgi:integrase
MAGRIVRRSPQSWTVIVDLGRDPITGRRVQHTKAIRGRKEDAEDYLRQVLNERDEGLLPDKGTTTLREYLTKWLQETVEPNYTKASAAGARSNMERHVIPYLGSLPLRDLRPAHFKPWLRKVADAGRPGGGPLAPATLSRIYVDLHAALQDAVDERVLRIHPMRGLHRPRVKQRAVPVLDRDGARRVHEVANHHHYGVMVQVAILTGMRPSELLGLRWPNVTFHEDDSGTIKVVENAQWVAGYGWSFGATKTDRPTINCHF